MWLIRLNIVLLLIFACVLSGGIKDILSSSFLETATVPLMFLFFISQTIKKYLRRSIMTNNIGAPMTWKEFIEKGRRLHMFPLDLSETGQLPISIKANLEPGNLNNWIEFLGLYNNMNLEQVRNHIKGIVGGNQLETDGKYYKFLFVPQNLFRNSGS